jgi:hypothetical protein
MFISEHGSFDAQELGLKNQWSMFFVCVFFVVPSSNLDSLYCYKHTQHQVIGSNFFMTLKEHITSSSWVGFVVWSYKHPQLQTLDSNLLYEVANTHTTSESRLKSSKVILCKFLLQISNFLCGIAKLSSSLVDGLQISCNDFKPL